MAWEKPQYSQKLIENVRADTAGSAAYIASNKKRDEAAIASKLSAKIYNLDILESNIENEKRNVTRFLIMGKLTLQPELKEKNILPLFIKLKDKPAALYSALSGFAIQGVKFNQTSELP